jgi:iron complex outermembrane receptor protein
MSQRSGLIMTVSGAALFAALSGSAAFAEAQPQTQASAQPSGGAQVSEIVVTAQHRAERLNEVPIAITVKSAAQLERAGVTNIRDLTTVTPGLRLSGVGANALPAIRGIHSEQVDPGNDANVAIYLDNVYQSNPLANNMDLPDIDRVEVLKGPQGTLFGRNATGGAIRIFTRAPSFVPTGMLDASFGNLNTVSVKGFASGPLLGEKLAGSLSGFYQRREGLSDDIVKHHTAGGLESTAVRAKLLAKPTDDIDVTLIGGYSYRHDGDAVLYQPLDGNTTARLFPGAVIPTEPRQVSTNPGRSPSVNAQTYSTSLNVEWRTDIGTVTSTSAYTHFRTDYDTDADATNLDLIDYPIWIKQRDISQELIFSSKKFGMAQLVAGAFYYNGDGRYDPLIVAGSLQVPTLYGWLRQQTQAWATFGELTISPIEPVNIILGARYSEEKRHATGSYFLTPTRPDPLPEIGEAKFSSFTPRASIRYTLPSDDNIYFTYSRGFKSGGFNISGGVPTDPFRPEIVDAYEVGLKTSPRRGISANVSAFYYKYKDQQVLAAVNKLNVTSNAASSDIKGVDAEITSNPLEGLTLTVGASYLDAHFDQYPKAVFNEPIPGCLCGNATTIDSLSGGQEPFSPKFTLGVTGSYHTTVEGGDLNGSVSVYHTSEFFFDPNARVGQGAYTTLNMRVGFKPHGTNLEIYGYGRNLTDTLHIETTFINNLSDGVTYAEPRTVGFGVKYEF